MKVLKPILVFFARAILVFLGILLFIIISLYVFLHFTVTISPPDVPKIDITERKKIANEHYVIGNNWLKKNEFGIWEMYLEGSDYERGVVYGRLAKELCQKQEEIFVEQ